MDQTLKTAIAENFKNTAMGFLRIKKNLGILHSTDAETEDYQREIILATPLEDIETKGKNYYFSCFEYKAILTVNSSTFTIITAKKIKS